MKKRKKNYVLTEKVSVADGTAVVLVYGELWEDGFVDGLCIQRVGLSRDGRRVLAQGPELLSTLSVPYARTKSFNFGWAICSPEDDYDEEVGIALAKKRFSMYPLTTQSGNLLTDDMNIAILQNELDYILNNFYKFYRRNEDPVEISDEEEAIKPDDFVVCTRALSEQFKRYYHLGRVKEVSEDGLSLHWEVEIAETESGTMTRNYRSGSETKENLADWRVATDDEVEAVNNILTYFDNKVGMC